MANAARISLIATVLSMLASVATSIIIATMLGPEGRGIYAVVFVWATTMAAFGTLSIGDVTGVAISRGKFTTEECSLMLARGLVEQIVVGLVLIAPAIVVFSIGIQSNHVPVTHSMFLLAGLTIISASLNLAYVNYHRSLAQHYLFNLNRVAFPVSFAFLLVLALVIDPWAIQLQLVLNLYVIAATFGIVMNSLMALHQLRQARAFLKPSELRGIFSRLPHIMRSGFLLHIPTVLFYLTVNIDKFAASWLYSLNTFGIYSVASSIAQPSSLLFIITVKTLLVGDRAIHDPVYRWVRLKRLALLTLAGTVLFSLAAGFVLHFLVPIVFGKEYESVVVVSAWLLLGNVLSPLRGLVVEQARVRGMPITTLYVECVFIASFCSALVLLRPFLEAPLFGASFLAANILSIAAAIAFQSEKWKNWRQ